MQEQGKISEKKSSPYRVFMWGALLTAALCFGLAAQRISVKRPARADAYTIAGILGLLSAAAAWSSGSAHERSRRSQEGLQGAVEQLQSRMHDLPRALMADAVQVAEKERQERRVDQERHAGELRQALNTGLREGFAPIAPALSEHIGSSLAALSGSLQADREERARNLREMSETISGLQTFQKEWAQTSSSLLGRLGEQGTSLHREISERDADWRAGLEKLSEESGARFQKSVDLHLSQTKDVLEGLAKNWDSTAQSSLVKMETAIAGMSSSSAAALESSLREARAHLEKNSEILLQGLGSARESLTAMSHEASERIRGSASQAEGWLEALSRAAGTLQDAAQGAQRMGEESAANQAGMKAVVETLNQSLTGVMDRLQSFASLAQGQQALLEKMETTVRRFEERSAELLEENALKIQESFLDALEKADSK